MILRSSSLPQDRKSRCDYIDNVKLICLFLILFCHIPPASGDFHAFCYSFHVQVFFLFAGAFFKPQSMRNVVTRSFKTLLVPYFIWNMVLILLGCLVGIGYGFSFTQNVANPLVGTLLGSSESGAPFNMPAGPSWFLVALFIARIILCVLLKMRVGSRVICLLAIGAVYYFNTEYWHMWVPFSIPGAILGLPFMLVGYYFRKCIVDFRSATLRDRLLILILCLSLVPLAIINGTANMYNGLYGRNFLLFLLLGVSGSLLLTVLCSFINFSNSFTRLLISGSTFFICCHMMIMEYAILLFRKITGNISTLIWEDKIIISVVTVVVFILLLQTIRKFTPQVLKYI